MGGRLRVGMVVLRMGVLVTSSNEMCMAWRTLVWFRLLVTSGADEDAANTNTIEQELFCKYNFSDLSSVTKLDKYFN